jgi:sterol desaturase/sphingolipid hydroxylase (fatty acid hydroxylase superfamily)
MFGWLETLTLALVPAFMLLDLFWSSRSYDSPRFWRIRAFAVSVAAVALSIAVPLFWSSVLPSGSLLDLSGLGTWAGALVGILVYELVHYWYHRLAHKSDLLWRAAHQMHHSAESLDAFGANYLHPVDVFFFGSWASLVLFPVLGVAPEAGMVVAFFVTFNAMFQHANIRTPQWLGYLIQRPESHALHHASGKHRNNYSDLPLWDMVFGTFQNPREANHVSVGFYKGASSRILEMLFGKDVSEPEPKTGVVVS